MGANAKAGTKCGHACHLPQSRDDLRSIRCRASKCKPPARSRRLRRDLGRSRVNFQRYRRYLALPACLHYDGAACITGGIPALPARSALPALAMRYRRCPHYRRCLHYRRACLTALPALPALPGVACVTGVGHALPAALPAHYRRCWRYRRCLRYRRHACVTGVACVTRRCRHVTGIACIAGVTGALPALPRAAGEHSPEALPGVASHQPVAAPHCRRTALPGACLALPSVTGVACMCRRCLHYRALPRIAGRYLQFPAGERPRLPDIVDASAGQTARPPSLTSPAVGWIRQPGTAAPERSCRLTSLLPGAEVHILQGENNGYGGDAGRRSRPYACR